MKKFFVRVQYPVQISHDAEFEVEASSQEDAEMKARDLAIGTLQLGQSHLWRCDTKNPDWFKQQGNIKRESVMVISVSDQKAT